MTADHFINFGTQEFKLYKKCIVIFVFFKKRKYSSYLKKSRIKLIHLMLAPSLNALNSEIRIYQKLIQDCGDTRIIPSTNSDPSKVMSDELLVIDENIHIYLTFLPSIQKIKCVIYVTEIDSMFVEQVLTRVGLRATEANLQNYQRDPTLVEKYWNERFIEKYHELMKYFRKTKITCVYQEKFQPTFNKNQQNEIVDNYG